MLTANAKLILMICPPIISIVIYYISKFIFKHKRRSFHLMISLTTIFYVFATVIFIEDVFSIELYGIIPIVLLVMLSIILILQWKNRTEVILKNGLKVLWRLNFLIFIPLYCGFVIYLLVTNFIMT